MPFTAEGTAYQTSGPADAPCVILIHGLGLTLESTWAPIQQELSKHFYTISYDLLGHGQSSQPQGEVTLTALSVQLAQLMDSLGVSSAALVGFSLGGMINRRFALDHPERATALAILNSPHDRGEEQQAIVEKRARDSASSGPSANIDATLERWFTSGFRLQHPETVNSIRSVVLANHHDNYASHRWVLANGVKELIKPSPPISHPALVVTCENDTGSTPAMSHAIAAEIAGAETIILPELQHLGLIEAPQLFSELLIRFLNRPLHPGSTN